VASNATAAAYSRVQKVQSEQTVNVDVVDEVDDLLLGDLKPQTIHDRHELLGRDAAVVVFVEQRERLSQLLATHTDTQPLAVIHSDSQKTRTVGHVMSQKLNKSRRSA